MSKEILVMFLLLQNLVGQFFNQLHQSRLSEDGSILSSLVASMAGKDYWQLSGLERAQPLMVARGVCTGRLGDS